MKVVVVQVQVVVLDVVALRFSLFVVECVKLFGVCLSMVIRLCLCVRNFICLAVVVCSGK